MIAVDPRVGASEVVAKSPWQKYPRIFLDVRPNYADNIRVTLSATQARDIARTLKRYADFIDPPKKRVAK